MIQTHKRDVVLCKDCFAYQKDQELARAANMDPDKYCALLGCEMPCDGFCYYGPIQPGVICPRFFIDDCGQGFTAPCCRHVDVHGEISADGYDTFVECGGDNNRCTMYKYHLNKTDLL